MFILCIGSKAFARGLLYVYSTSVICPVEGAELAKKYIKAAKCCICLEGMFMPRT